MTALTPRARERLDKRQFAYVDKDGGEHLPIHDASHVRNAIARFNQTAFDSKAAKERARKQVLAAAKRHGIEVAKDDKIARPTTSLRAASTKQGPKGGRRTRSTAR